MRPLPVLALRSDYRSRRIPEVYREAISSTHRAAQQLSDVQNGSSGPVDRVLVSQASIRHRCSIVTCCLRRLPAPVYWEYILSGSFQRMEMSLICLMECRIKSVFCARVHDSTAVLNGSISWWHSLSQSTPVRVCWPGSVLVYDAISIKRMRV